MTGRRHLNLSALLALLCVLCVTLTLTGCGGKTPPAPEAPSQGVPSGKSYTVRGVTYYPLKSAEGYSKEGIASWYGPGFHGKKTASGEPYDQMAMTAAHTILPLGSRVEVTNLNNGRSVIVRINDRGPFVAGRIIDLSRAAAYKIDMIGTGTARVRVRHVSGAGTATAPAAPQKNIKGSFSIQLGAFKDRARAEVLVAQAEKRGVKAVIVPSGNGYLQVRLGPWDELNKANDVLWRVREHFPTAFIVSAGK